LEAQGHPTRVGSRSADLPFDWNDDRTWAPILAGVRSVYISYHPDLAVPGAVEVVDAFMRLAVSMGVRRQVLLTGRGEEEAQRAERALQASGADWTILRASWFAQNFSETFLLDPVLEGTVALPVGDIGEPFVDVDDIADVAVAALTQEGHEGRLYELTGPRLLTFADVVHEIGRARGRPVEFAQIEAEQYAAGLRQHGVPDDFVSLVLYLFTEVLDGRNAYLGDGVQQALGRPARDFGEYARLVAAAGVWESAA
jgi:uncharacterized protein YbjT (DUF2867 family)